MGDVGHAQPQHRAAGSQERRAPRLVDGDRERLPVGPLADARESVLPALLAARRGSEALGEGAGGGPEDGLIRASGVDAMLAVTDAGGALSRCRTFRSRPAEREGAIDHRLWCFIGTKAMRKVTWAPLRVEAAFDAERFPAPLERLIDFL